MKRFLTVAALLAGLAAPAVAGEKATTIPPPSAAQAAVAPSQEGTGAETPPQSQPVAVVPMSVPLESNAAPPPKGGGCGRSAQTVYLTN